MHQQIHDALKKAFQLGQTYWQQADSDSFIQHRKSDETHAQFLKLCEDTLNNLTEKDKLQAEDKHPAPMSDDNRKVAYAAADKLRKLGYRWDDGIGDWVGAELASPTAGMNIAQRILHVGGRNNAAGYVEFGSIQAVEALVQQVLRDQSLQTCARAL